MAKSANRYPGIDAVKFLMAIVVISIHTLPSGYFTAPAAKFLYDYLCASAVPFFFVSSGFLIAQKADRYTDPARDPLTDAVGSSLKKFLKMYLLWMLIYAPLAVLYMLRADRGLLWCIFYYLRGFLLMGEHYNSWPLWYLLSMNYGLFFLYLLCRKKVSLNRIVLCSMAAFLCSSAVSYVFDHAGALPEPLSRIAGLLSSLFSPNRIVTGFLYVSLGILAYRRRFSNRMGFVFLLLHMVALLPLPEPVTIPFKMLSGLGLLILASNWKLNHAAIFPILRTLSVVMYFLHMYVWTFYYGIVYGEKTYGTDSFLVTTLVCTVLGLAYVCSKPRYRARKLKRNTAAG